MEKGFIPQFMEFTANLPSPKIYRKWGALFSISAALTKRVWTPSPNGDISPNSSIVLVGAPGVGKGPVFSIVEPLLRSIDYSAEKENQQAGIRVGPNDTTPPGIFDELREDSSQKSYTWNGKKYVFQNLTFLAEELAAFLHNLDRRMMGFLIVLLNGDRFSQRLRAQEKIVEIPDPVVSLFGGVQPDTLHEIFPQVAWGMGLTARTIFIFSNEPQPRAIISLAFMEDESTRKSFLTTPEFLSLANEIKRISLLTGPFRYSREAGDKINSWWLDGEAEQTKPVHPRLEHYAVKRISHLVRLSMLHSASRGDSLMVEAADVYSALRDLLEAESAMPKIFSSIVNPGSQANIVNDLIHQMKAEFRRTNAPLPYHVVLQIISTKVAVQNVIQIFDQILLQNLLEEVVLSRRIPGAGGRRGFIPVENQESRFSF